MKMKTEMKINVLWLCLLLLLVQAPAAVAQRKVSEREKEEREKEAHEVIDRLTDNFRKAGGIEMHFEVLLPDGSKTDGRISLKGERFKLEAPGMTTWFDGATQWTYLHQSNEVNISTPTAAELQSLNPYAWLHLHEQGYQAVFRPALSQFDDYSVVFATTGDPKQEFSLLIVRIDSQTHTPRGVAFWLRADKEASTKITVKQYKDKCSFADSHFRFDPKQYPDAEVIDLR